MISDQNKKINYIVYNILNLPSQITIPSKGIIRYYYDATGSKLQKRTIDNTASPSRTTVTNYIGGVVYQNDTLQFFGTPEGRVRANEASTGWLYDYFLKDHLGNTRMMITDDYNVASPILEAYSYYPFGLQQKGIGLTKDMNNTHNRYTYNGKELQEDLGLDQYDYGRRLLDPQLGLWNNIDPKADHERRFSPFLYSANNPLRFIDPDGMQWKDSVKDGEIAQNLLNEIDSRLKTENKNLSDATQDLDKINNKIKKGGSSKKLDRQLKNVTNKINAINGTIGSLKASSKELKEMGSKDVGQWFTFKIASGEVGGTEKINGVIVMRVLSSDGNKIHEATHAYQIYNGSISSDHLDREILPYTRQLSFEGNSYKFNSNIPSYWGKVDSPSDISRYWILGIHNSNGDYIYSPLSSNSATEKVLDEFKNEKK